MVIKANPILFDAVASLSRGFEKSRMELSRLNADDELDDGSNALVSTLRQKICVMDEQCDKLDREKTVLADLLNSKKRDFDQVFYPNFVNFYKIKLK